MVKKLEPFDKYFYYLASVQSPESDVSFMHDTYLQLRGKKPKVLREDFCGTFANCCSWVKLGRNYTAIGVDLDQEPLDYGTKHHWEKLSPGEQKRTSILRKNVLDPRLPTADVICALNFSYFCFKERPLMLKYFRSAYKRLAKDGMMIMDCFGGSKCYEANLEETEFSKFSYFWDQDTFNPINNHCKFHIHYQRKGEPRRNRVFTYDWRLWSLPELSDILTEAGFSKVHIYWEGSDKKGEGNGVFTPSHVGEECESWIAYLVATK